jgi:hypothetical protein
MSNVDFFNPSEAPQPRDRVKVEKLEAKPYPDGWRVRVILDLTPFQERPSLELRVRSAEGQVVSELSVIETMIWHMEFTVHIRGISSPVGDYVAQAVLYYGDDSSQAQHALEVPFTIKVD